MTRFSLFMQYGAIILLIGMYVVTCSACCWILAMNLASEISTPLSSEKCATLRVAFRNSEQNIGIVGVRGARRPCIAWD
jgi:hypothetical protein